MFNKATREQSKLRLCITGISGSGKTIGALTVANELKGDKKIAFIDTENGSASLYSDRFDFDVLNMEPPYNPEKFVDAIKFAENSGYSVIIIDSASHEWSGEGGCLELNDEKAKIAYRGNTWAAWNDTTPRHMKFINAMIQSKSHIICTARNKKDTTQEKGENGKTRIVHSGIKLIQRDGFEYEFTICLEVTHDGHYVTSHKDRTGLFENNHAPITKDTGKMILEWLNDGRSHDEITSSYVKEISQAKTEEQLKAIFSSAWKALGKYGDEFQNKAKAAYDKKKETLNANIDLNVENMVETLEDLAMAGNVSGFFGNLSKLNENEINSVINELSENAVAWYEDIQKLKNKGN